jgi:predicted RNase H-like HicB family nuclease
MDTCYYSIIERTEQGGFAAWVPDLPGVTAGGTTEEEVLRGVFRGARERLRSLVMSGTPLPRARPMEELPHSQHVRRLLLILS